MDYSFEVVPTSAIVGMALSGLVSLVVPIVLLIIWKKKTNAKISSFFIGCGTFVVFALIIESIFHQIILGHLFPSMTENIWIYALYGGFMAGLFEETGRFVSMKFLMKKNLNKENGIMYGIGHGGIEAILLVTITEVSNIATSFAVNSGAINMIMSSLPESEAGPLYEQLSSLWTMHPSIFYAAGLERMSAITLHIGLSYLVYIAVKDRRIVNYLLAVLAHMFVDAITVIMSNKGVNTWIMEVILALMVAAFMVYVVTDYKKRNETEEIVTESIITE